MATVPPFSPFSRYFFDVPKVRSHQSHQEGEALHHRRRRERGDQRCGYQAQPTPGVVPEVWKRGQGIAASCSVLHPLERSSSERGERSGESRSFFSRIAFLGAPADRWTFVEGGDLGVSVCYSFSFFFRCVFKNQKDEARMHDHGTLQPPTPRGPL